MSDSVRPHRRQPTRLPRPWDSPGKNTGVGCHFLLQCMKVKVKLLSCVRLLATPWTAAYQAPPSMGFSRQEYWSGVPLPSLGELYRGSLKIKNRTIIWHFFFIMLYRNLYGILKHSAGTKPLHVTSSKFTRMFQLLIAIVLSSQYHFQTQERKKRSCEISETFKPCKGICILAPCFLLVHYFIMEAWSPLAYP